MDLNKIIDRVPLLLDDEKWLSIVLTSLPELNESYDELVKLNHRYIEIDAQTIELKREKKRLLHEIIALTDDHQEGKVDDSGQIDIIKNRIHEINDLVDELKYEAEGLPWKIKVLNKEMGIISISWMYETLKVSKDRVMTLNDEIKVLRKTLGNMYEEKFSLEAKNTQMYQYVHGLLGKEITDQLDAMYIVKDEEND
jgi:uncharacterized coiled-coil DUF342 family protein